MAKKKGAVRVLGAGARFSRGWLYNPGKFQPIKGIVEPPHPLLLGHETMGEWAPRQNLRQALAGAEARLTLEGSTPSALFGHAALLHALGRLDEAQAGYLEVLKLDTEHVGALTQLGALLHETGRLRAAITVYRRLIALRPGDSAPLTGLGHMLWEHNDHAAARLSYEAALNLNGDDHSAHQGMAAALSELRRDDEAQAHAEKGFRGRACLRLPYRGDDKPVPVLVLAAATGGNLPVFRAIDQSRFACTLLFTEFFGHSEKLPEHAVVWNAIGDADTSAPALRKAEALLDQTDAPVLNHPGRVALTGRSRNATRLASIEDLVVPRVADFERKDLAGPGGPERLAATGFVFPLLLRARGFHAGQHFAKLDSADALDPALKAMPGEAFSVLQFLDARGPDGRIRKYRVMLIDGQLYPLHAAVSPQWKVHYFSADMGSDASARAEDAAFLEDMSGVVGPRALAALEKVRAALGLDYGGVDFSLDGEGRVLFFEANATMVIAAPDAGSHWDYRRAPVQKTLDAVNAMLWSHAHAYGGGNRGKKVGQV